MLQSLATSFKLQMCAVCLSPCIIINLFTKYYVLNCNCAKNTTIFLKHESRSQHAHAHKTHTQRYSHSVTQHLREGVDSQVQWWRIRILLVGAAVTGTDRLSIYPFTGVPLAFSSFLLFFSFVFLFFFFLFSFSLFFLFLFIFLFLFCFVNF